MNWRKIPATHATKDQYILLGRDRSIEAWAKQQKGSSKGSHMFN